jgi:hypothetical protein
MFRALDETTGERENCVYQIANALNGCPIALAGILIVLIVYVVHVW